MARIVFKDTNPIECIKTIDDAINYLKESNIHTDALDNLSKLPRESFEYKIVIYRIIVAALTHNEQRYLTTGGKWFPTIEFCRPGKLENCCGDTIIGKIQSEGEIFDVVGGGAYCASHTGLSDFDPVDKVSAAWTPMCFRSVNSEEVAKYISKQFGVLLFDIIYGGVNCDWKWVG